MELKTRFPTIADRFVKSAIIVLITILNTLSIVNIFASPFPFPPRTSIGMLTLGSITIALLVAYAYWRKMKFVSIPKFYVIDMLVCLYLLINAMSLLLSEHIYDTVPFRLLCVGVINYFCIRYIRFTKQQLYWFIHSIGALAVILSIISMLQLVLPDILGRFVEKYFTGDFAYGILRDFQRGRLQHWGSIIIIYPFFLGSALLLTKAKKIGSSLYLYFGFISLSLAFIVSNFRWTTIVFTLGTFISVYIFNRLAFISKHQIIIIFISFVLTTISGLFIASIAFNYNLFDRLAFKDPERDFAFTVGRLYLYKQSFDAALSSPLFGIGIGNYLYNVESVKGSVYSGWTTEELFERIPVASHNDMILIFTESGILGIFVYVLLFAYIVQKTLMTLFNSPHKKISNEDLIIKIIILVSLLSCLLFGLFENIQPNNYVFVFFLFGIIYILNKNEYGPY